ncbi:peptide-N4-(N-acetyl-beta- glucosaminyl)asparagine amidase [Podochytrium sp. JEL0797]|nr:peptide-N4-(N-acetyl-beta- glucosaminyl)asparagine amidase [Podochytrium sp. JEL0797]
MSLPSPRSQPFTPADLTTASHNLSSTLRLLARQRKNEQFHPHQIKSKLEFEARRFKTYLSEDLQDEARVELPVEELHAEADRRLAAANEDQANQTNPPSPHHDAKGFLEHLMCALLDWYKSSYMVWVNAAPCVNPSCLSTNTVGSGNGVPTPEELQHGAARVELYSCNLCHGVSRFPRFNDPKMLMKTRRGRCGEWANLFTLFSITMGFETRYVLDYTDHVWCEFYSEEWQRWVSCDPCEGAGSLDSPLMYEKGWKKKLDYVFAIGEYEVVDVFRSIRYTQNVPQLLQRRKLARESTVTQWTQSITASLRTRLPPHLLTPLLARDAAELKILMDSSQRALGVAETVGRQSGDVGWRIARGEVGGTRRAPPVVGKKIVGLEGSEFACVGDAVRGAGGRVVVTPDRGGCCGAVWSVLGTRKAFVVDLEVRMEKGGADGMAVVVQSQSGLAMGRGGDGLGYAGIVGAVAVEFDSWESRDTCLDLDGNHVSVQVARRVGEGVTAHHGGSKGCTSAVPVLNSGKVVRCRVLWEEKGVDVWMAEEGGELVWVLRAEVEVAKEVGNGQWWIGVTAATGGLCQRHEVLKFNVYEQ